MPRNALGRGLGALIREPEPKTSSEPAPIQPHVTTANGAASAPAREAAHPGPQQIDIDLIEPSPYQPRTRFREEALDELSRSIQASGIIQPLVVRPIGSRFQLIAGERRTRASRKAGKTTIPALVKEVSDQQALEMTIIENLQREDLNPMEQARAFERLAREFNMTQEQMAQRTGKDRTTIANYLRLLKLPFVVQEELRYNFKITFSHAKLLLMLDSEEQINRAAQLIVRHNLSVIKTEELVYNMRNPIVRAPGAVKPTDPNVREAELQLQRALGCRVRIKDRKGKGRIVIEYAQLEDFDRVVEALMGKAK